MTAEALPPSWALKGDFRDGSSKNGRVFLCSGTHNYQLCNRDHTNNLWGVGLRRMERAC